MPYNSETETFYQAPATVVDSTPDGDTVQEGFDDRLTPAMAGLYADLNLLKADGMISVGIPATTTARGIGRVATAEDAAPGSNITNGPAFLDAATWKASATPAAGIIPLADTNKKLDAWVTETPIAYATSNTAGSTAEKVASTTDTFTLHKGARVCVNFSNVNTVAGALTLNVNSTGAKNVYDESGTAVSSTNPAYFLAGCAIEFVYNGTNWVYLRRVVNSYVSGANWYRKWNDGYIEQGIHIAVSAAVNNASASLLVSMKTTTYTAMATGNWAAGSSNWCTGIGTKTTSSFLYSIGDVPNGMDVYICGY